MSRTTTRAPFPGRELATEARDALPPYIGLAYLDPSSVIVENGSLVAEYRGEGDILYRARVKPGTAAFDAIVGGAWVGGGAGETLSLATFRHFSLVDLALPRLWAGVARRSPEAVVRGGQRGDGYLFFPAVELATVTVIDLGQGAPVLALGVPEAVGRWAIDGARFPGMLLRRGLDGQIAEEGIDVVEYCAPVLFVPDVLAALDRVGWHPHAIEHRPLVTRATPTSSGHPSGPPTQPVAVTPGDGIDAYAIVRGPAQAGARATTGTKASASPAGWLPFSREGIA